jgi:hypothetical protein
MSAVGPVAEDRTDLFFHCTDSTVVASYRAAE